MASSSSPMQQQRSAAAAAMQQQGVKCPRCDSANTKFCYYNNYSLTQPRHFCKTCRRYWTKGGALRNVPIGGGCRKSKKSKSSSSAITSLSSAALPHFCLAGGGVAIPYHDNYTAVSGGGIASTIESLSSINQDLHWKLQQQRLHAMLYGGAAPDHSDIAPHNNNNNIKAFENNICFHHNMGESSSSARAAAAAAAAENSTAWFLENPYSMQQHNNNSSSSTNNNAALGDWSGMQTWGDVHQFAAAQLPQGKSTHGLIS